MNELEKLKEELKDLRENGAEEEDIVQVIMQINYLKQKESL